MSYWTALGLPGAPVSAAVEDLARWVQWAVYGVGQGVSGTNWDAVPWWKWVISPAAALITAPPNESVIRYNLSQFWAAKPAALQSAQSEEERRQIYRLDMLAHGTLNAVDEGLLYSKPPTYWRYWQAFLIGGSVPRDTEGLTIEARQAAEDAAKAARQAGLSDLSDYFTKQAATVEEVKANADAFWSQSGVISPSSWPVWVWVLVGFAGVWAWNKVKP